MSKLAAMPTAPTAQPTVPTVPTALSTATAVALSTATAVAEPLETVRVGSDWNSQAACRGLETDLFYLPDNARGRNKRNAEAAAKAVCAGCPVVAQCLKYALSMQEPFGVWGGKTPEEREAISAGRVPARVGIAV